MTTSENIRLTDDTDQSCMEALARRKAQRDNDAWLVWCLAGVALTLMYVAVLLLLRLAA